jgi:hypothetical protein
MNYQLHTAIFLGVPQAQASTQNDGEKRINLVAQFGIDTKRTLYKEQKKKKCCF